MVFFTYWACFADPEKRYGTRNNFNEEQESFKFCSEKTIAEFVESMNDTTGWADYIYVAVSAALTTTRYRRGENKAFVAIMNRNEISRWKISLEKVPEELWKEHFIIGEELDIPSLTAWRKREDQAVSIIVMALILNDPSFAGLNNHKEFFQYLMPDETVCPINDDDSLGPIWASGISYGVNHA